MNKQEKAEPDFSFVLDAVKELRSSNAYWRKRCLAAEKVIGNENKKYTYETDTARKQWQQLKSQTPSPTGDRDCEELKKEVERLKGLIEKLFKSPTHQAAMRAFDIDPEPEWEAFKQESNL